MIAREGILREATVSRKYVKRLTDPMFVNPPARLHALGGVANGHGGANKFSTIDFFGEQLNRTYFIVVNDEKFRRWASALLEARFREANPRPSGSLARAFTHHMHDSTSTGAAAPKVNGKQRRNPSQSIDCSHFPKDLATRFAFSRFPK
jgi:hypothetical protein